MLHPGILPVTLRLTTQRSPTHYVFHLALNRFGLYLGMNLFWKQVPKEFNQVSFLIIEFYPYGQFARKLRLRGNLTPFDNSMIHTMPKLRYEF